jgi:hypothetical protein
MYVDCVLVLPRIAQFDPGDEPLPEVVLSHRPSTASPALVRRPLASPCPALPRLPRR